MRADQVGVWHNILRLALELDNPYAPLRSVRLGCFDFICADGRTGRFTPTLMAQIFEVPAALVESTVTTLLELKILAHDGASLWIEDAASWFIAGRDHLPGHN